MFGPRNDMAPGRVGGQSSGGVGGAAPSSGAVYNPMGNAWQAQQNNQQMQQNLWRAEQRCAQGDGANCQLAQRLRQQMGMAQQQQLGQAALGGMRGQGGSMGTRGRGGMGRTDPSGYGQAVLQQVYGGGMGGGGLSGPGGW